jgi:hypothetical protein
MHTNLCVAVFPNAIPSSHMAYVTFRKYGRPIIHLDTLAIDCHCRCVGWQSSDRLRNEHGGPIVVWWTVRVILASCLVVSGVDVHDTLPSHRYQLVLSNDPRLGN